MAGTDLITVTYSVFILKNIQGIYVKIKNNCVTLLFKSNKKQSGGYFNEFIAFCVDVTLSNRCFIVQ